jgi:hypothetical protein
MDNGGFIYMPAVKVRARGKAAAGLSAGVKAGVIGGAIGRSPAYQRYVFTAITKSSCIVCQSGSQCCEERVSRPASLGAPLAGCTPTRGAQGAACHSDLVCPIVCGLQFRGHCG